MQASLQQNLALLLSKGEQKNNGFHSTYFEAQTDLKKLFSDVVKEISSLTAKELIESYDKLNIWYEYHATKQIDLLYKNVLWHSLCKKECLDFSEKFTYLKTKNYSDFYYFKLLSHTQCFHPNLKEELEWLYSRKTKTIVTAEHKTSKKGGYDEKHWLTGAILNNFSHFKILLTFLNEKKLINLSDLDKNNFLKVLLEQSEYNENKLEKIKFLIEDLKVNINGDYIYSKPVLTPVFEKYRSIKNQEEWFNKTFDYLLREIEYPMLNRIFFAIYMGEEEKQKILLIKSVQKLKEQVNSEMPKYHKNKL